MPEDTKLYNFRLPIVLMERVKAMAGKHSLSVTDVVLTKLRTFADEGVQSNIIPLGPPASEIANDLAHALVELGEANEIIERQAKEIAGLVIASDAAQMVVASHEGRIGELESYSHGLAACLDEKNSEIASLTKSLGAKPADLKIQALRSDPANRIIDPKVHHVSGPVLADTVPVVEGYAVGFNLKGQTKGKGKS